MKTSTIALFFSVFFVAISIYGVVATREYRQAQLYATQNKTKNLALFRHDCLLGGPDDAN